MATLCASDTPRGLHINAFESRSHGIPRLQLTRQSRKMTLLPPMPSAPSRNDVLRAIDSVPWDYLCHAYASARDAPVQLRCFVEAGQREDNLGAAVDWMWGAILHQGSIYSASPPVMWILADILAAHPNHPEAEAILSGLATLANGCAVMQDEDSTSASVPARRSASGAPAWEAWVTSPLLDPDGEAAEVTDEYFAACRVRRSCILETVAHAIPIVAHCVDHPDANVRWSAAAAWCSIVQVIPEASGARERLCTMIGNTCHEGGVWLSAIIGLDLLGENVAPLLHDPDRRIRLGAAMAKGTAGEKESVNELTSALADLEWLERAFPKGLAHQDMHLRFHVLSVLLDRTSSTAADSGLIAALRTVILQRASAFTADYEWGPILRWAFPERLAKLPMRDDDMLPLPRQLNAVQRAVLDALSRKDDIWNPTMGNAKLALRYVQIPHDRVAILRCLATEATSRSHQLRS